MSVPELRAPEDVPLPAVPAVPAIRFEGFSSGAIDLLARLRADPVVAQYQAERPAVRSLLQTPFAAFRDDLVINWVLPNRLGYETERNVFSRLLKNDFGAGGCHHHLWLSFYRPGRTRLTDVQLAHSLSPDGFETGVYVHPRVPDALGRFRTLARTGPDTLLGLLNGPLGAPGWSLEITVGEGPRAVRRRWTAPLATLPDDAARATSCWLGRLLPADEVVLRGPGLVPWALDTLGAVWPLYHTLITNKPPREGRDGKL